MLGNIMDVSEKDWNNLINHLERATNMKSEFWPWVKASSPLEFILFANI